MTEKMSAAMAEKCSKLPVYEAVLAPYARSLKELTRLRVYGAAKHEVSVGATGFMDLPGKDMLYKNALARHLLDEAIHGPANVEDADMLHATQRVFNALTDLEIMLRAQEEEDLMPW